MRVFLPRLSYGGHSPLSMAKFTVLILWQKSTAPGISPVHPNTRIEYWSGLHAFTFLNFFILKMFLNTMRFLSKPRFVLASSGVAHK